MNSITYSLTADDLVKAQRLHQRGGVKRYAWLVLAIVVAIATLLYASEGIFDRDLMATTLLALLTVIIALPLYAYLWGIPRMARRAFAQDRLMAQQSRFSWDSVSAEVEAEGAGWKNALADFVCWQANDDMLLLYRQTHLYHLIPTRAFADADQRTNLIDALVANGVRNIWPPK